LTHAKIRVLIVDDEGPARSKVRRYLNQHPEFLCVGEAENGEEAVQLIERTQPDLLILDIQMPVLSGFDVLRLLRPEQLPWIIFATAYDSYAIKAFEVSAVDYLLKPFGSERFSQALQKVLSMARFDLPKKVGIANSLLSNLNNGFPLGKIALRSRNRIHLIPIESIQYFEVEQKINAAYAMDGQRYWTPESMDLLAGRLEPFSFFRIHRSSLINLTSKFEVEPWRDGRLKLHFPNSHALIAARGPAKQLKTLLGI